MLHHGWGVFMLLMICVCLSVFSDEEFHRICWRFDSALHIQCAPYAWGGKVLQCEVQTHYQSQCLFSASRQVSLVCQVSAKKRRMLWECCCTLPFSCLHRNNLTIVDLIMVHGQGTTESLRLAGKAPGLGNSLRFKLTEAFLKDCSDGECQS